MHSCLTVSMVCPRNTTQSKLRGDAQASHQETSQRTGMPVQGPARVSNDPDVPAVIIHPQAPPPGSDHGDNGDIQGGGPGGVGWGTGHTQRGGTPPGSAVWGRDGGSGVERTGG